MHPWATFQLAGERTGHLVEEAARYRLSRAVRRRQSQAQWARPPLVIIDLTEPDHDLVSADSMVDHQDVISLTRTIRGG